MFTLGFTLPSPVLNLNNRVSIATPTVLSLLQINGIFVVAYKNTVINYDTKTRIYLYTFVSHKVLCMYYVSAFRFTFEFYSYGERAYKGLRLRHVHFSN